MKELLRKHALTTPSQADLGLLIVRLWFGLVLAFSHGWGKMLHTERIIGMLTRKGYPLPELLGNLAAMSEFLGGLFIAIGLLARSAAATVLITMLVAAFVIHSGDPFMKKEFALAYAIAALAIVVAGPGRFSLDKFFFAGGGDK